MTGVLAALVAIGLVGCASTPPPKELVSARQSYERARMAGAQQLVPAELHEARKALTRAEHAFAFDDDSRETRDWAYIADREARKVEALAGLAGAQRRRAVAVRSYQAALAQLERRAQAELSTKAAQLAQTQQHFLAAQQEVQTQRRALEERERELDAARSGRQMTEATLSEAREKLAAQRAELEARERELETGAGLLERERQARLDAERRAQAAMESLQQIAQVKEEARGLVITVSGSVLFASGKAELLPIAKERLDQVAEVLKSEPHQKIVVEGHTDAIGTDETNQRLSQQRAEAVRNHLISRGVPEAAIVAEGKGESRPIADNGSTEGRANNRRVEIVVQRAKVETGSPQGAPRTLPAQTERPQPEPADAPKQGEKDKDAP